MFKSLLIIITNTLTKFYFRNLEFEKIDYTSNYNHIIGLKNRKII